MSTQNPHDKFTKEVLSQKKYAIAFFEGALEKPIAESLKFEELKTESGSFVDREGSELHSDMLFSAPFKEDGKAGIYILFEHASSPKKDIDRQLFSYLAAVYKDKKHLSVVVPLVLYHGKGKWPEVKSLIDLLNVPSGLKDVLRKYVPDFTYVLVDVTAKETDFSVFTTEIRAFLKTLKEIWNLSDPETLKELFIKYYGSLSPNTKFLLVIFFQYIIRSKQDLNAEYLIDSAEKFLPKEVGDEFMTVAEQLEKRGMEKGIEKGREEGIEKGREEVAKNLLASGIDIDVIHKATGLSKTEIKNL